MSKLTVFSERQLSQQHRVGRQLNRKQMSKEIIVIENLSD